MNAQNDSGVFSVLV